MGSIPRTANASAMKNIKAASKAYEALADAYEELDNMSKLKAQAQAGGEIWAEVREMQVIVVKHGLKRWDSMF